MDPAGIAVIQKCDAVDNVLSARRHCLIPTTFNSRISYRNLCLKVINSSRKIHSLPKQKTILLTRRLIMTR